jgi:prevent-host-death family protein
LFNVAGMRYLTPRNNKMLYGVFDKPDQIWSDYNVIKNVTEAKAELSALLEEVAKGREIIIGKAGRPIAKLVPYSGLAKPRPFGALRGKIRIAADFDELPEDIAEALGAK